MNKMKRSKHINILVLLCLIGIAAIFLLFPAQSYAQERLPIKVLRIQYFPLVNGRLDESKTGKNLTYNEIVTQTNLMTQETEQSLEQGSRYHGYKNPSAPQYLDYQIIETKEFLIPIPRSNNQTQNSGWYRPDYQKILSDLNICNYVENLGVKQVWMWGYHHGDIEPAESNMSGPNGDISNSEQINDMPICNKTYVLYNYSYSPGTSSSNALHDHMHQIENALDYMDLSFFWDKFVRPYGSTINTNNCGWTHMPPNTGSAFDFQNPTTRLSRCEDWHPDQTGVVQNIGCSKWGCTERGFYVWWMQNLPGKDHNLTFQGQPLRNWWDATYDFDQYLKGGQSLLVAPNVGYDNINPVANIIDPPSPSKVSGITRIRTGATDNIGVISHKILIDNFGNTGIRQLKECGAATSCIYDLNIDTMELLPDERPNHFVIVVEARDARGNLGRTFREVEAVRGPTPAPFPGDITGDNHVTLADLSIVLANFGKTGTKSQGDVNSTGTINLQDLTIILSNFGK